jgi:uncharacterized protein (DUF1015 family)
MANVVPFKAVRPTKDKVHLVASRSVDGYNPGELRDKLAGNPFTFLHVINPDFEDGRRTRPGSKERLGKVKRRFASFVNDGIFVREDAPAYYVYSQFKDGVASTGIIACAGIDDYLSGVIKVHEETITQREEKLKEYLEVCEFNAEPVLFCYPNVPAIDELINEVSKGAPEYDFTTTDKVRHTLWVVKDADRVNRIGSHFSGVPYIYIADGHHRSASSALLGLARRKADPSFRGDEPFNFFLGVFFAEKELRIMDYNRLVKDPHFMGPDKLIPMLKARFDVREMKEDVFKPRKKHELSMYTAGKWFALSAKEGTYRSDDPVGSLDASILTNHILAPVFDIHDLKIDKRIAFVPGVKGAGALKRAVDDGKAEVAFGLYPVTMEHLKWIADTHSIMPPKSTWIEPKMRSGLVIYSFEQA